MFHRSASMFYRMKKLQNVIDFKIYKISLFRHFMEKIVEKPYFLDDFVR
jgi:hypothetical protein